MSLDNRASAWRLDQLMLLGTVALVTVLVALSGMLQALASRKEFDESAASERVRLQDEARKVARSTAQLLSITSFAALRNNDYTFVAGLTGPLMSNDANLVRIVVLDAQGNVVADTAGNKEPIAALPRGAGEVSEFHGRSVLRYGAAIESTQAGTAGGRLGSVLIDYSLEPLRQELARVDRAKAKSMRRIEMLTVVLGVGFTFIGMVVAAFLSRRITQPLAALTSEAMRIANGELDARVQQTRQAGHEVLTLGTVFNYMADQVSLLLQRTRETVKLEHDLEIAKAVQEMFLPSREAVQLERVRLAGTVAAADQCGGDWWAHVRLDERRLALCIGDVTGHGISTALVAAGACSSFVAATATRGTAAAILTELNRTLYAMYHGKYQMTGVVAVLDLKTGAMEVARAAHPFPLVYNRHTREFASLMPTGPHIGEQETVLFKSEKVQLRPGDVLLCYSDGLIEADNGRLPYGPKRLRDTIAKLAHLPAPQLRDAVLSNVEAYANGMRADDVTLVVLEYDTSEFAA